MRGDPLIGRRSDISIALDDVGDLRPALPMVKKTAGGGQAMYTALCPAALTDLGGIKPAELYTIRPERESGARYVVREHDIVFLLRWPFRLVYLDGNVWDGRREVPALTEDVPPLVAVGQMAVLTVDPRVAEPGYVAWYLRHPETVQRLRLVSKGATLQFIPMKDIRGLTVPLPNRPLQQLIAAGWQAQQRAARLAEERDRLLAQYIDAAGMKAVEEATADEEPLRRIHSWYAPE
jgi:hypothetical protein